MELKDFIKKALTEIIEGVSESQKEIKNAQVIPNLNTNVEVAKTGLSQVQKIEFEVAVNVVEEEGIEAKLSVMNVFIGGQVKGGSTSSSGYSSKIKFGVPVQFNTSDQIQKL